MNRKLLMTSFFEQKKDTLTLSQSDLLEWVEIETDFKISHSLKYDFVSALKIFLIVNSNGLYKINWDKVTKVFGVKKK